jgi:uncharacterized membrane protein (DUF373 family)
MALFGYLNGLSIKVLAVLMILVITTALMGKARKVIIFDLKIITSLFDCATAAVVLAPGLTYWLITKQIQKKTFC